jgi:hypothetical protein
MLHRDGPGTEESSPSPLTPGGSPLEMGREVRATKGRPEEARRDLGAVLQPHSTDEGGELQGSRKGRPQDPLEGRGKQAYESVERKHNETQNSRYMYTDIDRIAELAREDPKRQFFSIAHLITVEKMYEAFRSPLFRFLLAALLGPPYRACFITRQDYSACRAVSSP